MGIQLHTPWLPDDPGKSIGAFANRVRQRLPWFSSMRGSALAICLIASLLSACQDAAAPAPAARAEQANVLLITIDTVRPDALGFVAQKNQTPHIDELARSSFRFPSAVSPVPLTLPTHVSVMTAQLPRRHGVHDNSQLLGEGAITLARRLKDAGYQTAAVISGFPLRRQAGLDLGFDRYVDDLPEGAEGWLERNGEKTTAIALDLIKEAEQSNKPWFLWVHYYDAHDPYTPPAAFVDPATQGTPHAAYLAEVRYLDHALAPLLARASANANGVTVLASDHGEAFGEHGEFGHGHFIYDSTTLVPLVIHAPGKISAGESQLPARLIDVAPTILDLLSLPALVDVDGQSLVPQMTGADTSIPPAYVETRQPWIGYGWAPLSAWREAGRKLINAPRMELYDLRADPGELKNLAESDVLNLDRLQVDMLAFEQSVKPGSATSADAETLAKLSSLGYVSAGSPQAEVPASAADPKDRLSLLNTLNAAEAALRAGLLDQAITQFEQALLIEPENRMATLRIGISYLKKEQFANAVTYLQRAIKLDPEHAEAHYALADALSRSGQIKAAIPVWMETARLQPKRAAVWSNLGTLLAQDGRLDDALDALQRASDLEPKNVALLVNLAYLHRAQQHSEQALALMLRSAEMAGSEFDQASTLGLMLLGASRPAEAKPWLLAAKPSQPDFVEAKIQLALLASYSGDRALAEQTIGALLQIDPRLAEPIARNAVLRPFVESVQKPK